MTRLDRCASWVTDGVVVLTCLTPHAREASGAVTTEADRGALPIHQVVLVYAAAAILTGFRRALLAQASV